jgi:hypothetical protein
MFVGSLAATGSLVGSDSAGTLVPLNCRDKANKHAQYTSGKS